MSEDVDVPVKVVDRRRWREDGTANPDATEQPSLKPTYVEELERRVAQAEKQTQDVLTKYRGAQQEFEDARARLRKEVAKDAERSRREVLVSLLEVVDNLDRAIEAANKSGIPAADPLLQGVELVRQQFLGKLDGFGVRRIASEHQPFDPQLHEAVTTVPTPDAASEGRVLGVIAHGYRIGDDVLRPALVAVGKRPDAVDEK
jgi:molecular chaperone GrpE